MDNERKFYRYRTFGSTAALMVLDNRSFRDNRVRRLTSTDAIAIFQFLSSTFAPGRTMLGSQQFQDLQQDLLDAQQKGITWKFVAIPEPIQNMGPGGAEDRFEGYAAERRDLLKYIVDNQITNVVFVAADIHGTLVNNLTYQNGALEPQIATNAFEVTTGSVAFNLPFGPTVVSIGVDFGIITPTAAALYASLPVSNDADSVVNDKDDFVKDALNRQLQQLSYDPIGLAGSPINATLLQGDYIATHSFGWTEFEITPANQLLTVTTYGIAPYSAADLANDPGEITSRNPAVVSQFTVAPVLPANNRLYLPQVSR